MKNDSFTRRNPFLFEFVKPTYDKEASSGTR